MEIEREFVQAIHRRQKRALPLIEVVIGPRQVGKTTGIRQFLNQIQGEHYYVSADGDILKPPSWITDQWIAAQQKSPRSLLVIDEVQKVENWAETIKKLWDSQQGRKDRLRLILLGSSSLQLQQGLSESLAGRFFLHKVFHWTYEESRNAYGLDLDQFLRFGGYPGSYSMISRKVDWLSYMRHSIVDAVVGKDILSLARVKSPSLFKQCFELACSYGAQEISYTKLLGQLQDRGNTELVKHYLELFEHAFLIKQLFKFSLKKTLVKSSSPKILPLCPALYSITQDADLDSASRGRSFEIAVGALLNTIPGDLFYWRNKNKEVDYVFRFGKKIWAIEVESSVATVDIPSAMGGLHEFKKEFPSAELIVITPQNYQAEIKKIKAAVFE